MIKYPQFDRDTAAVILSMITNSEGEFKIISHIGFANESLFCEWCYVVDLDKNTFEVYKGFNKEALPENERFYSPEPVDGEYYPVRLRGTFDLDNLPTEEEFLMMFEEDDDEV